MSYIGKTPTVGNFIKLDSITTSSTNSYTLQQNSVNFSPESANHMLVSLNGVIQAPNTAFSVSGSTITFLPSSGTLSSSDVIDFIMVYGNVLDVGVATTVTDSAITKGKLNLISDSSTPGLTVKGDGSSENGTIQLNCSQNSHGVKISSPAHSAGQSYELILPTGNVTADKVLKVASVSGSGTTGIGQLSFGDAGGAYESQLLHVRQEVNAGTDSQTLSNSGANTRILNTVKTNEITGASLSSNEITLPAGTYFCLASAPAYLTSNHQCRLFNTTDSADVLEGTTEHAWNNGYTVTHSFLRGRFTISGTKGFTLRHYVGQTKNDSGGGTSFAGGGSKNIYAEVMIWKVG